MRNILEMFMTVHESRIIVCSITEFQLYGGIPDVHGDRLREIIQDIETRIRQRYHGNVSEELNKKISEVSTAASKAIEKMVDGTLKPENEETLSVLIKEMGIMMEYKM